MEKILEVKTFRSRNTTYFRVNIPKELSNELELKEGDKIHIKILEVIK